MIHYTCQCPDQDQTIPVEKQKFLKRQRDRAGPGRSYNEIPKGLRKKETSNDTVETDGEDDEEDPDDPDFSPGFDEALGNYANFYNFGLVSLKLAGQVSKKILAELATAIMIDLKLVTPDNQDLIITASKIDSIHKKVGEKIRAEAVQNIKDNYNI